MSRRFITFDNALRAIALIVLSVFACSIAAPVVVLADALDSGAATTNHDSSVTSSEIKGALLDVPGILSGSDQVVTRTDADSAIVTTTGGTTVDVPKDPAQGVTFGATTGPKLEVELPSAGQASDAKQVAPGVVAYDSGNGSANAVQANEDGSLRMLTIIDNPSAPTEYEYKMSLPEGGRMELAPDGGAVMLSQDGVTISAVGAPWATDADGTSVATWYTTTGQVLTQHVQHNVHGVVYPVTADPWFWNYMACILGAGVPLGAAMVIYALPATWYALTAASSNPRTQTTIGKYIIWVKNRCGAFIRS